MRDVSPNRSNEAPPRASCKKKMKNFQNFFGKGEILALPSIPTPTKPRRHGSTTATSTHGSRCAALSHERDHGAMIGRAGTRPGFAQRGLQTWSATFNWQVALLTSIPCFPRNERFFRGFRGFMDVACFVGPPLEIFVGEFDRDQTECSDTRHV
jgi:hypothetical protein